jgi:hypothetical protein
MSSFSRTLNVFLSSAKMNNLDPNELLSMCMRIVGKDKVTEHLIRMIDNHQGKVLTIIANAGNHYIPPEYMHGEIYEASRGSLRLDSELSTKEEYRRILANLATKLRETSWNQIYLVPTGPVTLSLQIKIQVYHITRLDTIDLFYLDGNYFELRLTDRNRGL